MDPSGVFRGKEGAADELILKQEDSASQFESGKQGRVSLKQSILMKTSQIILIV